MWLILDNSRDKVPRAMVRAIDLHIHRCRPVVGALSVFTVDVFCVTFSHEHVQISDVSVLLSVKLMINVS